REEQLGRGFLLTALDLRQIPKADVGGGGHLTKGAVLGPPPCPERIADHSTEQNHIAPPLLWNRSGTRKPVMPRYPVRARTTPCTARPLRVIELCVRQWRAAPGASPGPRRPRRRGSAGGCRRGSDHAPLRRPGRDRRRTPSRPACHSVAPG